MKNTALGAAHMVAGLKKRGGPMIKIRIQGTKDDISWLENQINTLNKVRITESSDCYQNQGTNRYFRKYIEVEKHETIRNA